MNNILENINKNIIFVEKFNNEKEFHYWFRKNYHLFGFTKIIKDNFKGKTPDFIVEYNNKELKLELETISSNFIIHSHKIEDVDLVLCLIKDVELPIKTIELNKFLFTRKTTLIQISDEQWLKLNKKKNPAEPFEKVLERILRTIEIHKLWEEVERK